MCVAPGRVPETRDEQSYGAPSGKGDQRKKNEGKRHEVREIRTSLAEGRPPFRQHEEASVNGRQENNQASNHVP